MNKTILIAPVIVLVGIGGYFLLKGSYQAPEKETAGSSEQPSTIGEVKEIAVSGTEFSFSPASITVKAGEKVRITFRNDGRAPHDLVVEGLGISTKTISGDQSDTLEFTAPSSETYTFFCSVPGHRSAGMEGNLKVE